MAYDEDLAARLRDALAAEPDVEEKRMFGGLAFLLAGHMAVCAGSRSDLMVRVARDDTDALVATTEAEPMEMRGRPMRGWVTVAAAALDDAALDAWVARGVATARALPPK